MNGWFCISDEQRGINETDGLRNYWGDYTDFEGQYWTWECSVPPPPPPPPPRFEEREPDFTTEGDTTMELLLWIHYLLGIFWVFGWVI